MWALFLLVVVGTAFCEETEKTRAETSKRLTKKIEWLEDINEQGALLKKYYKERDFDSLSNLYTEDCVLMPPGSYVIKGRPAFKRLMTTFPHYGVDSISLIPEEVTPFSNLIAADRGVCDLRKADGSVWEQYKYLKLWRRVDGKPKIYMDIWNSNS